MSLTEEHFKASETADVGLCDPIEESIDSGGYDLGDYEVDGEDGTSSSSFGNCSLDGGENDTQSIVTPDNSEEEPSNTAREPSNAPRASDVFRQIATEAQAMADSLEPQLIDIRG